MEFNIEDRMFREALPKCVNKVEAIKKMGFSTDQAIQLLIVMQLVEIDKSIYQSVG